MVNSGNENQEKGRACNYRSRKLSNANGYWFKGVAFRQQNAVTYHRVWMPDDIF